MSSNTAPALLTWLSFITVINCHAEPELDTRRKVIETRSRFGYSNLVSGGRPVADNGYRSTTPTCCLFLVYSSSISQSTINPTQEEVIKCDIGVASRIGNMKLNGIPIPGAVGAVFMVVVCDNDADIDIV